MMYKFSYDFPEANTVSLIGDFNNWDRTKNVMELDEDGKWTAFLEIEPGKYTYKYLIDNMFMLNDPLANLYIPNEDGEMLSILIIDDKGDVLINTEEYSMNLDRYVLWNKLDNMPEQQGKKSFLQSDESIICRLEFSKITGVHSVAALWYTPDMQYYHMSESLLWTPEGEENKPVEINFYINVRDNRVPTGRWKIKIFIDGGLVFEDYFLIKAVTYSNISNYSVKI